MTVNQCELNGQHRVMPLMYGHYRNIRIKTIQYLKVRSNNNNNSVLSEQRIRKSIAFSDVLNCSIFLANTTEDERRFQREITRKRKP